MAKKLAIDKLEDKLNEMVNIVEDVKTEINELKEKLDELKED